MYDYVNNPEKIYKELHKSQVIDGVHMLTSNVHI